MQCRTHGCEYPREFSEGRFRSSCCYKCRYTRGRQHDSTCTGQEHQRASSYHRSRSGLPSSSSSSGSSSREAVVPEVREFHQHCFVITLGLRGHYGMQLLEHIPDLLSNAIDARSLKDPNTDQRGGPWGTCITTQQQLLRHPNAVTIVAQVVGRILSESRVVVFCEAGHHRSVGVAEIAVQEIKLLRVVRKDITTIHIDAKQCTEQQWEDLWNGCI